jgi:hypothetical protein
MGESSPKADSLSREPAPSAKARRRDKFMAGFVHPPASARPRIWWHWMNGNISLEGIDRDLKWMRRIGIGGVQNFDGALDTPQVVDDRLSYMSTEWRSAFAYAVRRADELGLEFGIASSPGWSETGGPWVAPEDGMKKIVWTQMQLNGGVLLGSQISAPPSASGPFQHLDTAELAPCNLEAPRHYRDIAVVAYRTPAAFLQQATPVAITTNSLSGDVSSLPLCGPNRPVVLPLSDGEPAWVLYDYGELKRWSSVAVLRQSVFSLTGFKWTIEASCDGNTFSAIAQLPDEPSLYQTTVCFPPVTARFMRLIITPIVRKIWFRFAANAPGADCTSIFTDPVTEVRLYSLVYYGGARVHRFEDKAGFAIAPDYRFLESSCGTSDDSVNPDDIIDLTEEVLKQPGSQWNAPPGSWTVLRLGYSLTGKTNQPASREATGLEVDKLDDRAVRRYLDAYLGSFEQTVGRDWIGRRGIHTFLTDSIESQGQNWTPRMIEEFLRRRGYNPIRWLPVLTGVVVGDPGRSDRFLWDFRTTINELIAESHYQQIANAVHSRGMIYYSESLEGYSTYAPGDDLDMRAPADIPMAAIWTSFRAEEQDGILNHIADVRGAASVAHVYGKSVVAVEAFTSGYEPWAFCPKTLRPVIDLAFALGANRPVIHTSVHQPTDQKPGITLGPFGQHFTRHETWGGMAKPWIAYLSRCSYLLQQGDPVVDVAWYYGERGSLAGLYSEGVPSGLPEGYGFDFISPNMLLNALHVIGGQLVSSGGAHYRLLFLGGKNDRMSLRVLRKLSELAAWGIPIAGPRPSGSPSLADDDEARQREYRELVSKLWDEGKVLELSSAKSATERLNWIPDFRYSTRDQECSVLFVHRHTSDGDIYFLTNRKARQVSVQAIFRVRNRRPELWHAEDARCESVSWRSNGNCTVVDLTLNACQSVFVIFREVTNKPQEMARPFHESVIAQLEDGWVLTFQRNRGAPDRAMATKLGSWAESQEFGIKYFSGIGTYRTTFIWDCTRHAPGDQIFLDLGVVHEVAEVTMNRRRVSIVWHLPYRIEITNRLKHGLNALTVKVANLWVNRLIGDQQPGITRVAFTTAKSYHAEAPLRPSGLIGPVVLIKRRAVTSSENRRVIERQPKDLTGL